MSASRVSKQYLPLTSLRFFAALGILIHHYGESLDQLIPKALHPFIHTGGWGITLFFVLSGFILSFAYEDKIVADKLDLREFYVNRFARVYPLYAFALIISLPQVLLYVKANPGVFGSGYLAAFIVSKFTLLSTWSPEFCIRPPLLLASWTLCAEALFYLIFPFVVRPVRNLSLVGKVALMAICAACYVLLRIHTNVPEVEKPTLFWHQWVPIFRVPEFLIGIAIGQIGLKLKEATVMRRNISLAMLLMLPIVFGLEAYIPLPVHAPLVFVSMGLLLWSWVEPHAVVEKLMSWAPLVLLGEASYSLYLLHGPVFGYMTKLLKVPGERIHGELGMFLVYAVASILVSIATYKAIEVPMRGYLRNKLMAKR